MFCDLSWPRTRLSFLLAYCVCLFLAQMEQVRLFLASVIFSAAKQNYALKNKQRKHVSREIGRFRQLLPKRFSASAACFAVSLLEAAERGCETKHPGFRRRKVCGVNPLLMQKNTTRYSNSKNNGRGYRSFDAVVDVGYMWDEEVAYVPNDWWPTPNHWLIVMATVRRSYIRIVQSSGPHP